MVLLLVLLWNTVAFAAASENANDETGEGESDDDWGDGLDDSGFAEFEEEAGPTEVEEDGEDDTGWSSLSLTGFVRSDWGLWAERLDDNPFAKGRQNLDLALRYKWEFLRILVSGHAEYDLAYLHERDSYNAPTLKSYEWLADVRESYVTLSFDYLEFAVGRLITAWGEGDVISLVDVVGPRDSREPGITDPDDLRLPVLATRISFFLGYHRFDATVVHESFFGLRTPPFGPFSPLTGLLPRDYPYPYAIKSVQTILDWPFYWDHLQDRFEAENQQFLARWSYKGPGIDLALYFASHLDQQGVLAIERLDLAQLDETMILRDEAGEIVYDEEGYLIIEERDLMVPLDHRRYMMLGHSGAWPVESWLFKWELRAEIDRSYNVWGITEQSEYLSEVIGRKVHGIKVGQVSTLGFLAGISHTWSDDARIFVEFTKSFLLKHPLEPLFPIEEPTTALGYIHSLFRNDLEIELGLSILGWFAEYGFIGRLQATYTIMDGLKIGAGYITYQEGDAFGVLSGFNENDRLFVKLRWDFTLY